MRCDVADWGLVGLDNYLEILVVCDHGFMQLATSRALYLVFAVTNADSSKDWEGVIVGWVKWHDGWSWQI